MEPEKKSHGALIGSIIIIVILIIGGIYMWQQKAKNEVKLQQMQEEQKAAVTAEELNTLDQEVNSVDSNVDVDLSKVE